MITIYTEMPDGIACRDGVARVSEHDGTVWLWADPALIGWTKPITWLFSPVVGRTWPGDVWGVDTDGELLIVENKLHSGNAGVDPFEDFVSASTFSRNLKLPRLAKRWRDLLAAERLCPADLAERPAGTWPGVLPYSSHREAPLRWRGLYLKMRRFVESADYESHAHRNLITRALRGEPAPHFFGVATLSHGGDAGLSSDGREHFRRLTQSVGKRYVHATALRAVRCAERQLKVERVQWSVERQSVTP